MIKDISYIIPSQNEVVAAFTDFGGGSPGLLIGYLCFLVILALPLKQIDRRDQLCAMLYVTACTAVGVTTILAVPQRLALAHEANDRAFMVLILASLAAIRWHLKQHKKVTSDVLEYKANSYNIAEHETKRLSQ